MLVGTNESKMDGPLGKSLDLKSQQTRLLSGAYKAVVATRYQGEGADVGVQFTTSHFIVYYKLILKCVNMTYT